jgi:arylsulfatase A-like enzyme
MEDPAHPNYPQNLLNVVGPRNMVHSGRPTRTTHRDAALGQDRQAEDRGRRPRSYPKRMETVDDEIRDLAIKFMDKAKADGKPFFVWLNPTRMHVVTHLSPKYRRCATRRMAGRKRKPAWPSSMTTSALVMQKLKDMGVDDNTIVVFTTDNGTETSPGPMAAPRRSRRQRDGHGRRLPRALHPSLARPRPGGLGQNGIFSGLDWFPTFLAAAGNPNITEQLLKGVTLGDRTYKNHLDGYNQMAAITGKGPSARHEIFYLGESTVGAVRIDDYKYPLH